MRDTQYNPNKRFRDITIGKEGKQVVLSTDTAGKLVLDERVSGNRLTLDDAIVYNIRTRFTIAQVNAGATLLAAIPGYKYRMVECAAIAVGGAVAAVTTVDVLATQTTSVKLVAYAQASLTQSTRLESGDSGAAILADGASFVANDANTAITVGITDSDITTATHVDFIFTYCLEA